MVDLALVTSARLHGEAAGGARRRGRHRRGRRGREGGEGVVQEEADDDDDVPVTVDQDDADEEAEVHGCGPATDWFAVACAYRWLPFSTSVDCGLGTSTRPLFSATP